MEPRCTGEKISVEISADGMPFVSVPISRVNDVRQLFIERGIGHSLGRNVMHEPGEVELQVINIGSMWNRTCVEDALDRVQTQ